MKMVPIKSCFSKLKIYGGAMKKLTLFFLLLLYPTIVFCTDKNQDLVIYSVSSKYYDETMRIDFCFNEIKETPICSYDDTDFPVTQSEAIQSALKWTITNIDAQKHWKVQEIDLKFLELDTKHCAYVVQLQPGNDMQSLPVGVLMDGKIRPPVKVQGE
jgi:hypothetical protein